MYKIINYYDLLKKIKNIRFIRVDITTKCYKVVKEFFLKLGITLFIVRTDNRFEWVKRTKKKQFRRIGAFEMLLYNDYVSRDTTDPQLIVKT